MPINNIIREKRKEIGLTQEQIAEYLGVSAPAVSKWESGATYPDITMLPALARLLRVDLNTLLCFNEGLSEQEINNFSKQLYDQLLTNGFDSGVAMVTDKIKEYPNCGQLIHSAAILLDGALVMSGMTHEEKEVYNSQIIALYERAAKCEDDQVRDKAIFMLSSKYMGKGEYDKAQELLDLLPERSALDKAQLQANLFIQQNKLQEAAKLLERKLYQIAGNELLIILTNLAEIAQKEGNDQDAAYIADISRDAARLFGLWDYYSYVAPLQVALAREDVQESIHLLSSILQAALTPYEISKSPLYSHFASNLHKGINGAQILPALLAELENDPKYTFLRSNPEFQRIIKEYREKC